MTKEGDNLNLLQYAITVLAALLIFIDFALPGKEFTEDVLKLKEEKQQYYNAARNHHYSYILITSDHQFSVSEAFAKSLDGQKVKYTVSPIFKEVNSYQLLTSNSSSRYSLRIVSGLVLPLIAITAIFIAFRSKNRRSTLIFVLQVILLADLIFVLQ